MDAVTLVAVVLVVIIVYYLVFGNDTFPELPGPDLRDYLPGGLANKIFTHPDALLTTLSDLARLHGEIFQVRFGPTRTVVVTAPADIVHVVSSSEDFGPPPSLHTAFDAILPRSIFTMGRAEHLRARRKLRHSFNHSLLPSFHAPMTDAVREIVEELRAAAARRAPDGTTAAAKPSPVNINNVFATVTLRVILNVALGTNMDLAQRKRVARDVDTLVTDVLTELTLYPVRQAVTFTGIRNNMFGARENIRAVAQRLLDARVAETPTLRGDRRTDLLDAILALEDHDPARYLSQVSAFVVAGTHTVSVSLSWAMFNLCKHPRVTAKLEAEVDSVCSQRDADQPLSREEVLAMPYLHNVWKETQRLTPSVSGAIRWATKEVVLKGSGVKLPKGTQLDALFYVAQTSERYYTDAEKFIPERWGSKEEPGDADRAPTGAFLPFGAGQHACAGQFLAEYEGPLVLAELVRNFRFELACPAGEIRRTTGFVEVPRWSSKQDGKLDTGIPVIVTER